MANILGYDFRDLVKRASLTLTAGFFGVLTGWVLQPFFATVFGMPYWLAYWPAVMGGFVVNFATQVKSNNIVVKKSE